jgi:hypothetical protein
MTHVDVVTSPGSVLGVGEFLLELELVSKLNAVRAPVAGISGFSACLLRVAACGRDAVSAKSRRW